MTYKYAYYSKKEVVSEVEQPEYFTNDRGKEEKQYAMGSLTADINDSIEVTPKDIFDASSNKKSDLLKAIGENYTEPWYDTDKEHHIFNSYGFTPLMMATQAQCYDSIAYILGKIHTDDTNNTHIHEAVYQKHDKITDDDSSKRSAMDIANANDDTYAINLLKKYLSDYVTITYINSEHADLKIHMPESKSVLKGTILPLPSITGEYISNKVKWEPKRWSIGDFNSNYTLNSDTSAILECEKVTVKLEFKKPDSVKADIPIPSTIERKSGDSILLPSISGEYIDDSTGIVYVPTKWNIGEFGSSYTIYDNNTAELVCNTYEVTYDVVFDKSSMELDEGESTTCTFKLTSKPSSNVVINFNSDTLNSRLNLSSDTLIFTSSNWNTVQQVTFTAIKNNVLNDTINTTVSFITSSTDSHYNNLSYTIAVKIIDNSNIGTLAFVSGTFPIASISSDDVFATKQDTIENVHNTWSEQYSVGYKLPFLPKSPHWTQSNKVFNYDPLYPDDLDN